MATLADRASDFFFRYATKFVTPALFAPPVPNSAERTAFQGNLHVEVVSHCWHYSHLLAYHLSSIVLHPPENTQLTVTVYYCTEDSQTVELLKFFNSQKPLNVVWNWQPLPRSQLLRRAIGRNKAALESKADWIWFVDCDLILHHNCVDSLAETLQGRNDVLVHPRFEFVTDLLDDDSPVLVATRDSPLVEIDTGQFYKKAIDRAVGAYQIVHGDVARKCGYCKDIAVYQKPTDKWRKTYEDHTFRWLLGTQGVPVQVNDIYRIRHASKGRYTGGPVSIFIRSRIRWIKNRLIRR